MPAPAPCLSEDPARKHRVPLDGGVTRLRGGCPLGLTDPAHPPAAEAETFVGGPLGHLYRGRGSAPLPPPAAAILSTRERRATERGRSARPGSREPRLGRGRSPAGPSPPRTGGSCPLPRKPATYRRVRTAPPSRPGHVFAPSRAAGPAARNRIRVALPTTAGRRLPPRNCAATRPTRRAFRPLSRRSNEYRDTHPGEGCAADRLPRGSRNGSDRRPPPPPPGCRPR